MIFNVGAGGGASTADKIKYDNSTSGLTSESVQGAVDELNDNVSQVNRNFNTLGGFTPVIDETTGKITGYTTEIGGADTVFPFSGGTPILKTCTLTCNSGNTTVDTGLNSVVCVGCVINTSVESIWAIDRTVGKNESKTVNVIAGVTDSTFILSTDKAYTVSWWAVGY